MRVKTDLKAGAIICYDNSSGFLMPVVTPCSTPTPLPPTPQRRTDARRAVAELPILHRDTAFQR